MTIERIRSAVLATALAAGMLACSDNAITDPIDGDDPAGAAARLVQLADSVAVLQGEVAALPLREAADQLLAARRYSVIPLTVDGTTERWLAFSMQQRVTIQCPTIAPGEPNPSLPCGTPPLVTRSLVAWQPGDPRRMLVLTTAAATEGPIGGFDRTTVAAAVPAFLQFYSGRDQVWFGTSGRYAVNVAEGEACPAPADFPDARAGAVPTCRLAKFTWTLRDVTVGVPTAFSGLRPNAATGTHRISLGASDVAGTIVNITLVPRPPVPPVPPAAGLLGDLQVSRDGDALTFTFIVKNVSDRAVEVRFTSGQQFDFMVGDETGRVLWRWSIDKLFTQALAVRIIPPNESIRYSATWTPTVHGALIAGAMLTSSNVRLAVRSPFTVP